MYTQTIREPQPFTVQDYQMFSTVRKFADNTDPVVFEFTWMNNHGYCVASGTGILVVVYPIEDYDPMVYEKYLELSTQDIIDDFYSVVELIKTTNALYFDLIENGFEHVGM